MITSSIPSLIVSGTSANFSAHTYTEIYATASATPVINGLTVPMASGSSLRLFIRTLSNGANCVLLGDYKDVFLGSGNVI
jgi:hypothetical protein